MKSENMNDVNTENMRELTEEEMAEVQAGISFTKWVDKSSPVLFYDCASGKHITEA